MKFFLAILLAALALALPSQGAAVGDVQLGVKSDEGPLSPVWITKTASRVIGWDSNGVLGPITVTAGSAAWADVTGKPTTLAGYGITDSITAALAASTYQPLITDGSLTIARTNGLQAALDAKLATATAASTYQTIITDGSLTIARTNGLQAALDAKLSSATAAADYLTIAAAEAAYQPKSIALEELALFGTSTGGQWADDSVKLAKYGTAGELSTSGHLLIFGDVAANVTTLTAQAGVNPTVTLPSTTGTLALTTGNISGTAAGLSTTLAVASGGTGQTSWTNGQIPIGNSTGNTLTKATLTAGTGITITNGSGSITISSSTTAAEAIVVACSDETTALTTGTAKVTFRMPHAMTLSSVRLQVNTAPTGSVIIVDVKEAGTTIFSTKPQIATSAKTSVGGAVPGVLSDTALADDAEITINLDQIGSTIAGAGLKITLVGTRP